ncbi:LOW QUALITY PROTEIN: regulator of microtubule dynamics protein 3 [Menidia menidia]
MSIPLGRTALIGLTVGVSAGLGLLALIVYREMWKRRAPPAAARPGGGEDAEPLEAQEAGQQAVGGRGGLTPEQQQALRTHLDQVLGSVGLLRAEVAELRGGLHHIALQISQDIKRGVEESQRLRRRRPVLRERRDSNSSSSIYFTASQGGASACEETSEGGYSTAYADSDCTDRDTDREGGGRPASEEDSEGEEDLSCSTVLTLRQEDFQEEEEEGGGRRGGRPAGGQLALLLAQSDVLHTGDSRLKAEGFGLLLDSRAEFRDSEDFLWRLARAYIDMYQTAKERPEKTAYALKGREEAEAALKSSSLSAEGHKWFAVLSGLRAEHQSMHSRLKSSCILKEHLDRALSGRDDDPMCFFLLGRWCYEVATLDWLEKKAVAALYRSPPTSTLQDALENFIKAEALCPGFSRLGRLYIAMCHKGLGNSSEASKWTELALKMPRGSDPLPDDEETCELEAQLQTLTDCKI